MDAPSPPGLRSQPPTASVGGGAAAPPQPWPPAVQLAGAGVPGPGPQHVGQQRWAEVHTSLPVGAQGGSGVPSREMKTPKDLALGPWRLLQWEFRAQTSRVTPEGRGGQTDTTPPPREGPGLAARYTGLMPVSPRPWPRGRSRAKLGDGVPAPETLLPSLSGVRMRACEVPSGSPPPGQHSGRVAASFPARGGLTTSLPWGPQEEARSVGFLPRTRRAAGRTLPGHPPAPRHACG